MRGDDPALTAESGGFKLAGVDRVGGVCGKRGRAAQVPGLGGRELGRGARRQVSKPGTRPTPSEGGRAARPSAPRASAEVSGALASCPPAETGAVRGGGGGVEDRSPVSA